MNPPDDLVELGRIAEPYGLKGWVNVFPDTETAEALQKVRSWWLSRLPDSASAVGGQSQAVFELFKVLHVKQHAGHLVAHLEGVEHRELAQQFKGRRVHVSRSRFPSPQEDEYYWIDLIGCSVVNLEGEVLGKVGQVIDHGAHPILVVAPQDQEKPEQLIPFVRVYVPRVDLPARIIEVDWQTDYQ